MTFASLLILIGSMGDVDPVPVAVGLALALSVFAISVNLARHPEPGAPLPTDVYWAIGGLAAFYLAVAVSAGYADADYGTAGLFVGVIPISALALIVAMARSHSVATTGGPRDVPAEPDDDDPDLGFDDETPLGDTPEHSDAIDDPNVTPSRRFENQDAASPDE
jgi:hypothetical protein